MGLCQGPILPRDPLGAGAGPFETLELDPGRRVLALQRRDLWLELRSLIPFRHAR
jgi:hypothetical protein